MTWVARGFLGGRRELEIRTLPRAARRLSAPPSPQPSAASRNSPVLLLAIAVPAAALFASALVLLLLRFLRKRRLSASAPPLSTAGGARRRGDSALQRQLRQLFHLPDSGLDQSVIDALPVFLYKEIVGPKEPFDCAVCLCEFAADDKLRLLPACSHAFHLGCIDTWLQSNSTCPLCRGGLFLPGPGLHSPVSGEAPEEEAAASVTLEDGPQLPTQKPAELDDQSPPNCDDDPEKMVFPVRLGKFRSMVTEPTTITGDTDTSIVTAEKSNEFCGISKEEGDSSSSNNSSRRSDGNANCSRIDGRRCYSMGSCQYVEGDSILQVVLSRNWDGRSGRRRGLNLNPGGEERLPGKRLVVGSRGESFSVSKIWQWTGRKGKVAMPMDEGASLEGGLPWIKRGGGTEGSNS